MLATDTDISNPSEGANLAVPTVGINPMKMTFLVLKTIKLLLALTAKVLIKQMTDPVLNGLPKREY